ncbi:hypothetical protein EDB87DRAFT_1836189 [Lactarius vividus]|nr:hypothetical protein EDB87DRAFT_1836189 [Lactarius vividus]
MHQATHAICTGQVPSINLGLAVYYNFCAIGGVGKGHKGPPGPGQPASPLLQSLSPGPPPPALPRFDGPSGYKTRLFDQHSPPSSGGVFAVRPSPADTLALTNCLIVHPSDFKDGEHVLVKGEFPLTVKCVTSIPHLDRQWIGLASVGDTATIVALPAPPHPSALPFLETLTLEAGFLQRSLDIAEVFSVDDMCAAFVREYGGIVITIGQTLVFEYHGQNLRCVIKNVGVLAAEQRRGGVTGGGRLRTDSGIIMEKTDVAFVKDWQSKIRFKASMRKASPNAVIVRNFKASNLRTWASVASTGSSARFSGACLPRACATSVEDTVINQLLSKMDGVHQLNNVLVIGMTNWIDMIDEALLRPGRFEVLIEISLPDEHGRHQILDIHTTKMRQNGMMDGDVDIKELARLTKNLSGAAIGGLVKSATSFAFNRHEVQPAVGVSDELAQVVQNGIIRCDVVVDVGLFYLGPFLMGDLFSLRNLLRSGKLCVEQVRTSTRTPLVSLLLHGPPGTGKTALAATNAQASEFPFIKLITPDNMVGFSEAQKVQAFSKVFAAQLEKPDECRNSGQHRTSPGLGACGQMLLQYGTADPHGTHGKASPKRPPPSGYRDNLAPPDVD